MELTREIYEQVLSEYNEFCGCSRGFLSANQKIFLDKKFTPKREGWWYYPDDKFLAFIKDGKYFGWSAVGKWFIEEDLYGFNWRGLQQAPEELVIERVKEELAKRGYVEGVEVRTLYYLFSNKKINIVRTDHYAFKEQLMKMGRIWMAGNPYNPIIMQNGEWAEIIDTKKKRIAEIEKQLESLLNEVNQLKNK